MTPLALYLLKANVALGLFYLIYYLVLRQLTFYTLNRFFLVFGILFSLLFPFVPLPSAPEKPVAQVAASPELVTQVWEAGVPAIPAISVLPEQAFAYGPIVDGGFYVGASVVAFLILVRLLSLYRIHRRSVPTSFLGIPFRQITDDLSPFSFWQHIYANPARHPEPELGPILRHESVHVRQWHTLDVLLADVATMLLWFNPALWLLKKALKQNLEFLADREVLRAGTDRRQYQYLLLQVMGTSVPHLANRLHFPSLKKRIAMMNKPRSPRAHQLRFLVTLPLLALLLIAFRGVTPLNEPTTAEALSSSASILQKTPELTVPATGSSQAPDRVKHTAQDLAKAQPETDNFFKRHPDVVGFVNLSNNKFIIINRNGIQEHYQLDDERDAATAEKKYGKLPSDKQAERSSTPSKGKTNMVPRYPDFRVQIAGRGC